MSGWLSLWRSTVRGERDLFFQRFAGKSMIVHEGLGRDWLDELLKTGGGGRHFRIDLRHQSGDERSPLSWLVRQLQPLTLPKPLLVLVDDHRALLIRHLLQGRHPCHPAEIPWFIEDIRVRNRYHVRICAQPNNVRLEHHLPPEDNHVEISYGTLD